MGTIESFTSVTDKNLKLFAHQSFLVNTQTVSLTSSPTTMNYPNYKTNLNLSYSEVLFYSINNKKNFSQLT